MANKKKYLRNDSERARDTLNYQMKQLNKQAKKFLGYAALTAGTVFATKEYATRDTNETDYQVVEEVAPKTAKELEHYLKENDGIKLDADEILAEYSESYQYDDLKAVNEKYTGEYLEVTGDFNKAYLNNIEGQFITIKGDEEWYQDYMTIQCEFANEAEVAKLNEIEKGDEITVVGKCFGSDLITVRLDDCYVKEIEK